MIPTIDRKDGPQSLPLGREGKTLWHKGNTAGAPPNTSSLYAVSFVLRKLLILKKSCFARPSHKQHGLSRAPLNFLLLFHFLLFILCFFLFLLLFIISVTIILLSRPMRKPKPILHWITLFIQRINSSSLSRPRLTNPSHFTFHIFFLLFVIA